MGKKSTCEGWTGGEGRMGWKMAVARRMGWARRMGRKTQFSTTMEQEGPTRELDSETC